MNEEHQRIVKNLKVTLKSELPPPQTTDEAATSNDNKNNTNNNQRTKTPTNNEIAMGNSHSTPSTVNPRSLLQCLDRRGVIIPELLMRFRNSQAQEEEDEIEKTILECTQRAREEMVEKDNDSGRSRTRRRGRCG